MLIAMAVSAVTPGWAENSDFSGQVKKPVHKAIDTRQNTQKAEEKWRDERCKIVAVYEQLHQGQKQL
jgi:hypothetical protein